MKLISKHTLLLWLNIMIILRWHRAFKNNQKINFENFREYEILDISENCATNRIEKFTLAPEFG